jgi:glycosyltransferase involved in cell wall biosynthesis
MRALILTAIPPPTPGKDVHAIYRRLGTFVSAVAGVTESIEMLHLVPLTWRAAESDPTRFNESQSLYWGVRVSVAVVPIHEVRMPWWHYIGALFSILFRPRFSRFAGKPQVKAIEASLLRQPDLVFVHRLAAMCPLFRVRSKLPPVLFDLDDVEHRVKFRMALVSKSWYSMLGHILQVPALIAAERRAAKLSARTFVCSELDCRYLKRVGGGAGVVSVPNSLPIPAQIPVLTSQQTILFLGGHHYEPNAEAAERLISCIFPIVRNHIPTARVIIAGNAPECIPSFHRKPAGVEFTGIVADLANLYERSRVLCVPLSIGGGTRLKLIEGASYGKAMVSTTIGAEGLLFDDGTEILIRDDDAGIAEACMRLLSDDLLARRLGERARRKAQGLYDEAATREKIVSDIKGVIMELGEAK